MCKCKHECASAMCTCKCGCVSMRVGLVGGCESVSSFTRQHRFLGTVWSRVLGAWRPRPSARAGPDGHVWKRGAAAWPGMGSCAPGAWPSASSGGSSDQTSSSSCLAVPRWMVLSGLMDPGLGGARCHSPVERRVERRVWSEAVAAAPGDGDGQVPRARRRPRRFCDLLCVCVRVMGV